MKVIKQFYCTKEQKTYNVKDNYTGNRKDLGNYLEAPIKTKAVKKNKK
jgi:hypothetical protein